MEIDLNEIERLANAATSGPWIACGPSFGASSPKYLNEVVVDNPEDDENDGIEVCRPPVGLEDAVSADMEFIGAANPAVVLELVRRLRAADRWRDAVIDQLDVMHITSTRHKDDPVSAVHDCMAYSVNLALDPATSEQVRALIEAEREACAKVCELAISDIGDCLIIGYDRHDAGINVCTNLAKRIRSRNEPPKGE